MRTCTVCKHPKCQEVDLKLLNRRLSFRTIAHQYDLSRDALQRHYHNCLAEKIRNAYKKDTDTLRRGIEKQLGRMDKMIDAAEDWLEDANNPGEYSFAPRAEDVEIMYLEQVGEKYEKRKDMLQAVLSRLEGMTIYHTVIKRKSPVDAFIMAAREFRMQTETLLRLAGELGDEVKVDLSFRLDPMEKPEGAGE